MIVLNTSIFHRPSFDLKDFRNKINIPEFSPSRIDELISKIAELQLYCVFERSSKPARVSTTGRHNAQQVTLEGNPAVTTIRDKSQNRLF